MRRILQVLCCWLIRQERAGGDKERHLEIPGWQTHRGKDEFRPIRRKIRQTEIQAPLVTVLNQCYFKIALICQIPFLYCNIKSKEVLYIFYLILTNWTFLKSNFGYFWLANGKKKSRIRETPTLSTDADSRTDTNLKTSRDLSHYICFLFFFFFILKEVAWFF